MPESGSPHRSCVRHNHLLGAQLVCGDECMYTGGKQEDFFHPPPPNIKGARVEVIRVNTPRNKMMADPDWDWTRDKSHLGGCGALVVTDPNCEARAPQPSVERAIGTEAAAVDTDQQDEVSSVKQKRLLANFPSRMDLSKHVFIETKKNFGDMMQASENLDGPAAEVISEAETRLLTIGKSRTNIVVGHRKYIPRRCHLRGAAVEVEEEPVPAERRSPSRKKRLLQPRSSSWGPSYS
mmetsp:Transcript_89839/g.156951  ORF Transcript_89839/g.156951 Transcript_89839/m.156951 type:complete len:237 (+) Transcript_89839:2-712(+)